MYLLMNDLYQELNKFSEILIYGAGNYAKLIYPLLKRAGLKERIASFVVTEVQLNSGIDGIPIRTVKEIASFDREKSIVLAAVSDDYADEIVCILHEYKFINVLKMTDYLFTESDLVEITDKQLLNYILEQHIWNRAGVETDLFEEEEKVRKRILQRSVIEINKNTIVIISSYLLPRTVKIIGALVKKNYRVVILEYGHYNMLAKEELSLYNVEFYQCQDIMEVFYRALQYKPLAYYYDPMWGDRICPEVMIRHKGIFGKLVIALYDVLNDGYVQATEEQKEAEKYALENADGIVWRWFSKEFLEEKKGFVYQGTSIQFLDYCEGYQIESRIEKRDELHLCLVLGNTYGLLDETIYPNDRKHVEYARIDSIVKVLGERDDCIFHAFMGDSSKEDRIKFSELEKKYPNFKVFYGTKHNELIQKISKYDYGCFLYTDGQDISEFESFDNLFYGSTHNNAMSNKYFDYLDAGLPIIATRPLKLCEYLDKFGVIVKMHIFNLDIQYLKDNKQLYKKRVVKARKELLIDNQISKLISFLNDL